MVIEKAISWCFWRIERYQQRGEEEMVSGLWNVNFRVTFVKAMATRRCMGLH